MSNVERFIEKYGIKIEGTLKTKKKDIIRQLTENINYFVLHDSKVRSNPKYALMALEKKPEMIEMIGDDLKTNRDFLLRAVEKNVRVYHFIPQEFKVDDNFAEIALSKGLQVPLKWKKTRNFILQEIQEGNFKLKNANEDVKNDLEICLKVLENNPTHYQFVSDELKNHPEICLAAMAIPMENCPFFPKE
jgi:hypothetical protein